MDSSMTCANFSRLEDSPLILITCSWEITLIEAITQLRLSLCLLLWKSDIQRDWLSSEVIMRVDRSLKFTGFMMNAWESTEMLKFGNNLLSCLTTFLWLQLLLRRFSVCMVVFPQALTHWIRSDNLTECKKFPTKAQFAIYSGPTQMTGAAGASAQEVQATHLARTFQSNSTILTAWQESLALTNLWWTATTGHTKET